MSWGPGRESKNLFKQNCDICGEVVLPKTGYVFKNIPSVAGGVAYPHQVVHHDCYYVNKPVVDVVKEVKVEGDPQWLDYITYLFKEE
jgi:hypothetical protein